MFVKKSALNDVGEFVMSAHKEYHKEHSCFIRDCILKSLRNNQLSQCVKAQEVFRDPDPEKLKAELAKIKRFQPDDETVFNDINQVVEENAFKYGLSRFQTSYERVPHKGVCFVISRNICTWPTLLTKADNKDEVLEFFRSGHAEAMVKCLLYPEVCSAFDIRQKNPYQIDVQLTNPRKYMYGVTTRFLIPYTSIMASDELLYRIAKDLKKLDNITQSNSFFK